VKLAVSLIGPLIVTLDGLFIPLYEPVPTPVQRLKLYPELAIPVIVTTCPLLYQLLEGVTLPPGFEFIVR
jgi:hypothetical protein